MATEPPELPPLPPDFPKEVPSVEYQDIFKLLYRSLFFDTSIGEKIRTEAPKLVIDVLAAALTGMAMLQGKLGQLVGKAIVEAEETGQENLMQAAAFGVRDLFGVDVSPGEVGGPGDTGAREQLAERLGHVVMEGMFGAFPGSEGITGEQGKANAERLFGFNLGVALKGWMMGVVGLGFLEHYFPSWGTLKETVQESLGLGRIQRRAMAPILNTLIVEPFTAHLNATFRPKGLTVSEAVRALNRGEITEDDYFEMAAQQGYTRERAAFLKVVHSALPSVGEATTLYQLGLLDEAALVQHFKTLGYHDDFAPAMAHAATESRLLSYRNQTETLVVDMIGAREMDETEGEGILRSVGRTAAEIEALLGNARIRRSRPKRLSESEMQTAFEEGFISLGDLSRYHELEGYSPGDSIILEQLAIHKKLLSDEAKAKAGAVPGALKPRRLSESTLTQGFVEGMISAQQLDAALADLGYGPEQRGVIEGLAVKRKEAAAAKAVKAAAPAAAPRERKLLEGTLMELYVRGIIGEDALRRYLSADGYTPADQDALVALALQRQREAQLTKAAGQPLPPRELGQANLVKAFAEGFIDKAQLGEGLAELRFRPEDVAILEQLAQHERDRVIARDQAAAAAAEAAAAAAAAGIPGAPLAPPAPKRRRKATKARTSAPDLTAPAA